MVKDKQKLKELLKSYVVELTFTKKDGTKRDMICTLKSTLLPEVKEDQDKRTKKDNEDILAVWDLEKKAFRSFRIDSLISYKQSDSDSSYEL